MEQTVVLIKPDGVKRGLTGEILKRFERTGLKIVAIKMVKASDELLIKHYQSNNPQTLKRWGENTKNNYLEKR